MLRTPLGLTTLTFIALTGCGKDPGPGRKTAAPADPAQVAAKATGLLTGTPSCSNRGCHGDFKQPGAQMYQHAYTSWLHDDPHTNAYHSLDSKLGQEIGKKLGITPTTHPECLACHTTPQGALGTDDLSVGERAFGVGCESCHGAARDWLVPHREVGWKEKKADAKEATGFNALDTHARRAEVCAGCHVGAPADPARGLPRRDMNHDMIAAGHPRLMFEYGSYLANLPKHWTVTPALAAADKAWLVGQLATAKAAMTLLSDRADRGAKGGLWPELSEHDCYACHHGLYGESWRQKRGYSLKPGAVGTNRWYTALMPTLAGKTWAPAALDTLMAGRLPPAAKVSPEAAKLAKQLGALAIAAEKTPIGPALINPLTAGLLSLGTGAEDRGWDEYEQAALGLIALVPPGQRPKVRELLRGLAWPDDITGPPDGPATDFHPKVRKLFEGVKP